MKRFVIIMLFLVIAPTTSANLEEEIIQIVEDNFIIFGGGSGTMNLLPQMKSTTSPYTAVTTRVHAKDLYIPYGSATTSDLSVTGLTNCDTIDTDANGFFSCGTDADSGAGSAFAWTPSTNYGLTVNATTTGIWFQGIVAASSTSYFENASTSQLTVDQDAWFAIAGGNVGIGTTTPGKTLGVHGNAIVSGSLDIGGTIIATSTLTVSGLATFTNASTTYTSATTFFGALVGNADTATALVANGGNCSAGSYPLGVDASGAVESCTDATTEIDSAISTHAGDDNAHHELVTLTGQDYLTISTQTITVGTIEPDDLAASDFGEFTCNGTNCEIDNDVSIYTTGVISASSTSVFSINVGIGTTSPWGLLSVEQGATSPIFVVSDQGTSTPHLIVDGKGRIGISTAPNSLFDNFTITGNADVIYTATEADVHALEIDTDAAGFGDVKALDIFYDTGAISTGEDEGVILLNINESDAGGGDVFGLEILATEGLANIYGLKTGIGIGPISQFTGTFSNMDAASTTALGVAFLDYATSTTLDATMFANDNDVVVIGDVAKFEEMEFLLDTVASGAGIKPTFEFSTGAGAWTAFTPTDGTNGMRNTGVILWDDADISTWAAGADSNYLIRITRTANALTTAPIEDKIQISAVTEYKWDENGDIYIADVYASSTIQSTGNILAYGNVGIGTTTPGKLFSIHGNGIISGTLDIGGAIIATSTLTVSGNTSLQQATTTYIAASTMTAANCDVKARTDGSFYCGTDATGAGFPNVIYTDVTGNKHYTASTTATDNLSWYFANGFTSAASSTIDTLQLGTPLTVPYGGSGLATINDGFVMLGSGTGAITPLDVTGTGALIYGDGTTDPSVLAGGTRGQILSVVAGGLLGWIATSTFAHLSASNVFTGSIDIGAGTFELSQNQTATALGQMDFDITDNQLQIATTTNDGVAVIPTMIKLFGGGLSSTSPDFASGGRIPTSVQRDGFVVREFHCLANGGTSIVLNLSNIGGTTDSETITCDTDGAADTDITTNSVYAAGSFNSIEIGTVTGAVDYFTYSIYGHITPE